MSSVEEGCDCEVPSPVTTPEGALVCQGCGLVLCPPPMTPVVGSSGTDLGTLQNEHFVRRWGGAATTLKLKYATWEDNRVNWRGLQILIEGNQAHWKSLQRLNDYGCRMPARLRAITKILYNVKEGFSVPTPIFCEAVELAFKVGRTASSRFQTANCAIAAACVVVCMRSAGLCPPEADLLSSLSIARGDLNWGLKQVRQIASVPRVPQMSVMEGAIGKVSPGTYQAAERALSIIVSQKLLINRTARSICAAAMLIASHQTNERGLGITRISEIFGITASSIRDSYLLILTSSLPANDLASLFPQLATLKGTIDASVPWTAANRPRSEELLLIASKLVALLFPQNLSDDELLACTYVKVAINRQVAGKEIYRYLSKVLRLSAETIYLAKGFAVFATFFKQNHSRLVLNAAIRRLRNVFTSFHLAIPPRLMVAAVIYLTNKHHHHPLKPATLTTILVKGLGVTVADAADLAKKLGAPPNPIAAGTRPKARASF